MKTMGFGQSSSIWGGDRAKNADYDKLLENIVVIELLRHGYELYACEVSPLRKIADWLLA